ncbi:MAG: hypothetical protein FWC19_06570 [Treponema sp.]|nr:hypothetical protein [Treponema sp.]MCL2272448.1 hypothetical protein [Treponema sp.]
MASSAISILSGIAAAAAGLSGEKVAKSGAIPGLDLAAIIPALLGNKAGAGGNLLGTIASVATKSGLLNSSNIGKLAELAGSLITSSGKATGKAASATEGIAGLAAAIMGGSGTGASLVSIAKMATGLGKTAKDEKGLTGMATELGSTLAGKFGVNFAGSGTAVKALDKVLEKDTKTALFKAVLSGLAK